ncbi:MAG: glucosamine 6-phosphate synthetase [Tissierellaceae bacterium]|nr:glucosamine 6-phosphate synthetase [Tissierellaceae bacterium]
MCGLYGFVYYGKKELKGAEKLLENLALEAMERGIDATGYAFVHKGKIQIDKAPKAAYQMKYSLPKNVHAVIGHTRAVTQGNAKFNYNNHPFKGKQGRTEFAFAHNGIIDNEFEIREEFGIKESKIQTDSYVVCQLMEKMKDFSMNSLKIIGETVEGMFTFTFIDNRENLYIIKNDNPLTILHFPTLQLYIYASTDEILFNALTQWGSTKDEIIDKVIHGKKLIENIPCNKGDILIIHPNGKIERNKFKPKEKIWGLYNSYDYPLYDDEEYKELLAREALDEGITRDEFNRLLKIYSFEDVEYFIYTGRLYEEVINMGR